MPRQSHHLERCMGCYKPLSQGIYHPKCSKKIFGVSIPPTIDLSQADIDQAAKEFVHERMTVTGVQKKLFLQMEKQEKSRLTVVGSLGGGYIMKPPHSEYEEMPQVEDLTMHLAELCGIQVADHGLLPMKDGKLAYVTRRFDRHGKQKIAVEDLCQLSELLTEQKYRGSHEKTGAIIRKYSSAPGDDALRFFELVVFSYLVGNNDMHLKNFSLITQDPLSISLSPAYDLLAVRLWISEKDDSDDLALTLNGKKSNFKPEDFMGFATHLKIPEKVARYTLQKICSTQNAMEKTIDESFLSAAYKDKLKALIKRQILR